MPKIVAPKDMRSIIVRVRTNEAENKALKAAAKREKLSVAEFIRLCIERHISGKSGHK